MAITDKINNFFNSFWGKTCILLLRLAVGGVFIFSGFVKALDPWGSIYKFGEYLQIFGLGDYAWILLFAAISVATVEFLLGIFTILGLYRHFTPIAMAAMMVVMLPLTLYLAVTDKLVDCGCFGDAVTLSNWASFWKNVALTAAIVILIVYNRRLKNVYGYAVQWIAALFSIVYILVIAFAGYYYQPLIDFRPYPIGTDISKMQNSTESVDENDFIFVYEKNGVRQDFTIDSLPDDSWEFVDRYESNTAKAPDSESDNYIGILNAHDEPVDSILQGSGEQILLLFPDLKTVGISYTYLINDIYDYAQSHGVDIIGLTAGTESDLAEWNDISMAAYQLYLTDDSQIKMIARGNPSVVYLKDGVVKWKRTLQSISMDSIANIDGLEQLSSDFNPQQWIKAATLTYIIFMFCLLLINRTHVVFRLRRRLSAHKKTVSKPDSPAE